MTVTSRRISCTCVADRCRRGARHGDSAGAATPKFYLDDPISRIEDSQDASE